MADVSITVPPPQGGISINVGQTLEIIARNDCNFCCSIGGNFSPSIASLTLTGGQTYGPYTAQTASSGTYNTSPKDHACDPSGGVTLNAQSVQIKP